MNHDTRFPDVAPAVQRFSVRMPATRQGAHRARTLATEQLRAWGLPFETAAHIVAELAANAALHGRVPGRDFRLTLTATDTATATATATATDTTAATTTGGVLRIEVTDARADRLPITRSSMPPGDAETAESGRGLLLVNALADRWGVTSGDVPCKTVWAECDLPALP